MTKKFQPRYVAYATAHGNTPEVQLEKDRKDWPGGCMCGYILWVTEHWSEWNKQHGKNRFDHHSQEEHEEFDNQLIERYGGSDEASS